MLQLFFMSCFFNPIILKRYPKVASSLNSNDEIIYDIYNIHREFVENFSLVSESETVYIMYYFIT